MVDEFRLFVKGESLRGAHTPPGLPGFLRGIADTAIGQFNQAQESCVVTVSSVMSNTFQITS